MKKTVVKLLLVLLLCSLVLALPAASAQNAPVANFSAKPTSGLPSLSVKFTDLSTGSPTGWAWYFGDETFTEPWTLMTSGAGWPARGLHSSVVTPNGSIVLMGGWDSTGTIKNDVWLSTNKGATWTQVNGSAGWAARRGHTSVALPDGSIVLMGGLASDGSGLKNDVWRSTDSGVTWTQVTVSAGWTPRLTHSSVVMPDGSIVLMGGSDGTNHVINDVWRSTDKGATWTKMTSNAGWTARCAHSSVVMPDGSIVLMGGYDIPSGERNDVWRSTDKGATWTQVTASAGWTPRQFPSSVAMPDGSIVLTSGGDDIGGVKNDVWRSTDNGTTWTQVTASAGWSGRSYHSSAAMPDGSIVLMGGLGGIYETGSRNFKNDVWRFMPTGSSAQNPSHTYTKTGIYPVALQVYNVDGYNSIRKIGYITVTPSSSIRVTSPNGGETWQRGTSHTVTWSYTGSPGTTVKILLFKGGTEIGIINGSVSIGTSGTGSYSWLISSSGSGGTGNNYKIKVQSISTPTVNDTSDNTFNLTSATTPPTIRITSPNGGETWQRGTSQTVTWSYTGSPGSTVKIVLLKAGAEVGTIKSSVSIGTSGTGSYSWLISSSGSGGTGSDYKIKVQSISTPIVNDTSDNNFNLTSAATTPTIRVTSPNGGETWQRGTSQTVTWSYTGSPGSTVKTVLLKAGADVGTIKSSVSIGTGGMGSYSWLISSSGSGGTGSDYKVKVQSISQPTVNDTSNNNFNLTL